MSCNKGFDEQNKENKDTIKTAVCEECINRNPYVISEYYVKMNIDRQSLQEEYKYLWTECQRCNIILNDRPRNEIR